MTRTLLTFFFVSLLLVPSFQIRPFALAQSTFTPQSTWGSTSVYIEGKAFYVQSGRPNGVKTWLTQAFFISLNTTWAVASPAYTPMPNGLDGHIYANTLLPDGVTWAAIRNSTYYTYNLSSDLVIPAAYRPAPDANATMRFAPTTAQIVTPLPRFADVDGHQYYALAASNSAKAIFYFGGLIVDDVFDTFARLDYGGSAWSLVAAQGQAPSARAVTCMVAAYGGTKLVLVGGEGAGKVVLSDIYIYDVATNTWTRGPDGGASRARAGHACAASGDNIVVYGGYININRAPVPELTSVFSLKTNTWQQAFVPSGPIPTPPGSGSGGSGSGSGSGGGSEGGSGNGTSSTTDPTGGRSGDGPSIGAIAGGVGATLLVIVVILFWVRHRKRSKEEVGVLEKGQPTGRQNDPQLYPENNTPTEKSADMDLVLQLIERESRQYDETVVVRSPHTMPDPAVGRPEAVVWQSARLEKDISQLVATMEIAPTARGPQLYRSGSVQASQTIGEP
ncbi:hypothetical protein BGZ93_001503 [Podila epicladia]|nr:hypothetical protein BGZ93_001503 [Podila epicladia]